MYLNRNDNDLHSCSKLSLPLLESVEKTSSRLNVRLPGYISFLRRCNLSTEKQRFLIKRTCIREQSERGWSTNLVGKNSPLLVVVFMLKFVLAFPFIEDAIIPTSLLLVRLLPRFLIFEAICRIYAAYWHSFLLLQLENILFNIF